MTARISQHHIDLSRLFCQDCMRMKSPTCCRTSRRRTQFRMRQMRRLRRAITRELKEAGKIP